MVDGVTSLLRMLKAASFDPSEAVLTKKRRCRREGAFVYTGKRC